jgi:hypothetical protein
VLRLETRSFERVEREVAMLKTILWGILLVWMGIALVILAMLVWTGVASLVRTVRDRRGVKSTVYCPVHRRTMAVVGIPTSFGDAPFDDLRRCEAFEEGGIRCEKTCLRAEQAKTG